MRTVFSVQGITTILRSILLRFGTTLLTLLGVAIIVFFVIRVVPGNPIAMMLPPGATDADILRLEAQYGLDKSIPAQFFIWLGGVLQGDFGTSITSRQPVSELVLGRLPATLELSIVALVMACMIGGALALTGTRLRGTRAEAAIDASAGVALSVPDFLWGLVLILLFGVLWPVFQISGRISPSMDIDFTTNFFLFEAIVRLRFDVLGNLISHMFMPALALALPLAAIIAQLLKQSLKETMHLDYVTLARTKGYSERQVITREALPNAILPTLTLVGVQFTFLIGGTVIIERLFSYEGLGNMAIDAVVNRDLPLIQGIVLLFALLFTVVNLVVDMLYVLLNPRLRHA
ncbi:ABC transporter permease [Sulfitobacter sp.]|nr:ABC transporter permease [Sulfitobacter sp.]